MSTAAPRHVPVVVVGAGQAGLSASWYLTRHGVEHLVLERDTAAHAWRDSRWDHFTLVTPNWQCRLPGFPYPGPDPDGFMTREQVLAYLADYVAWSTRRCASTSRSTSVQQDGSGGFLVSTAPGER